MRRNSAMLYTNWEKWAVETWARPRRPKAEEFLLRLLLLLFGPARLLYPTHIDWVIFFFFSWSPKRQANLTTTIVTNVNTRKNNDRWRHARLNSPTHPAGQSKSFSSSFAYFDFCFLIVSFGISRLGAPPTIFSYRLSGSCLWRGWTKRKKEKNLLFGCVTIGIVAIKLLALFCFSPFSFFHVFVCVCVWGGQKAIKS